MKTPPAISRRMFIGGTIAAALAPAPASAFTSTRMSVAVRGDGPDVILIHGINSGRGVWNGTLPALAGFRCHYVQISGFAGVPAGGNRQGPMVTGLAAEIARYIAEARLVRPAIIGHSMGGTIATIVAARWAQRVGRLMVVDMLPQPAGLLGGTASNLGPFAQSLQRMFSQSQEGRDRFAALMRMFSPPGTNSDPDVTGRAYTELANTDLTAELGRITAPATIVFATPPPGGSVTPVQIRQNYAAAYRNLRGARLVPVADSGHMIMFDQPARFNAAVKAFLDER